ncbi:MAG: pyruvate kinase [Alkalispirochaeta sp.]
MLRKTKIVATMGPAVDTPALMKELLKEGVNVARFNFSHGSHEEQRVRIEMLREASQEIGIPVAFLLDTKGPEIRTGLIMGGGTLTLNRGDAITLTTDEVEGTSSLLSVSYKELPRAVQVGGHIFVADGLIDLEVQSVEDDHILCIVRNGGTFGSKKNVNVPGVRTALPAVTEKDIADILFAVKMNMDFVAASFIRKAQDVLQVQQIIDREKSPIRIISKIEDQEGLENIAEITRHSAGIMVARGDLGVQLETAQIPLAQKRIIKECNLQNKPVITATQMLDSMIVNPKPTRAESTDVANAIFDGTDAVMLSGETAGGKYPVESVRTLHKIAIEVEKSQEYIERSKQYYFFHKTQTDIADAITKAAYVVATDVEASVIVAPTLRGNSPRLLSKYRPLQPIIAVTTSDVVYRQLLIHWGIYPILAKHVTDSDTMIQNALQLSMKYGYVRRNDKVVTAAGIPLNSPIMMNTIKVHYIGNILNRGQRGFGTICSGNIVKARSYDHAKQRLKLRGDEILLVPTLTTEYEPLLPHVRGIIAEDAPGISIERIREINPSLVFVSDVRDAYRQLEHNQSVSLDGDEKIVYEGYLHT